MITPAVAFLDKKLKAAGIPIIGVRSDFTVDYDPSATPEQITQGDAIAAAFDGLPRSPRLLYLIYTDLQALSASQKTAVWNNLSSGNPKKYLLDAGQNAAAICAVDLLATEAGFTGAALTAARLRIAAMYVQDNPDYLVNPSFDNTINISGEA